MSNATLEKASSERFSVAKAYGVALFKKSFGEYAGGKPSKFANAINTRLAGVEERERVANLAPPAPAGRGGYLGLGIVI